MSQPTSTPNTLESERLFTASKDLIPGGVNSPVRAFKSVGGTPRFISSAAGAYLHDVDGNVLIDYIGSWGPMILGHNHPKVREAIATALERGTSFGAPNALELDLARLVTQMTGAQKVRFVSSGTEATMSALRLARGFTGRKLIVKFRGNYHGHADGLLVEAGSGMMTLEANLGQSAPSSAGVPPEYAALTLVSEYNDAAALNQLLAAWGSEIAAIIFEAVVGNSGVLIPSSEFVAALHAAKTHGIVLIADEVMTGFRLSSGGATQLLALEPDLSCWGKIIGGGLPVGAYGGRAEIMDFVSPQGPVYQAGTLSGNPLAMAAGIATLTQLNNNPKLYTQLEGYTQKLASGLLELAHSAGIPLQINQIGSMMTAFFAPAPITNYQDAAKSDTARFAKWFHGLLERGIYWSPSQFESIFVSAAHGDLELEQTLEAAKHAFLELK